MAIQHSRLATQLAFARMISAAVLSSCEPCRFCYAALAADGVVGYGFVRLGLFLRFFRAGKTLGKGGRR